MLGSRLWLPLYITIAIKVADVVNENIGKISVDPGLTNAVVGVDEAGKEIIGMNAVNEEVNAGYILSQSRRLPPLQVVSNSKFVSVRVQSPTEINAPRGCAVILKRLVQEPEMKQQWQSG